MFLATFLVLFYKLYKYKWAYCYILIIAVLHDVSPHFLRVPAPGAEEMSHFCSVMDAGTCRYIPAIEIWTWNNGKEVPRLDLTSSTTPGQQIHYGQPHPDSVISWLDSDENYCSPWRFSPSNLHKLTWLKIFHSLLPFFLLLLNVFIFVVVARALHVISFSEFSVTLNFAFLRQFCGNCSNSHKK